jgi:hypothetical protein
MAGMNQPAAKFARRGSFAGPLQTDDHPYGRRARAEKRLGVFAQEREKFIAHDFDDLLIRRKLQKNLGTESFLADVLEDFIGNVNVDVAFEQRFPDFSEPGVQVLFGELSLSAQIFEGTLELVG